MHINYKQFHTRGMMAFALIRQILEIGKTLLGNDINMALLHVCDNKYYSSTRNIGNK